MPLTVLSDAEINAILYTLNREDVLSLQNSLADALHEYSTGTQETTGCCHSNQPQRIAIPASNNQTTLFMPASTSTSRGIKIATLTTASDHPRNDSLPSIKSTTTNSSTSSETPTTPTPTALASQISNISIGSSTKPDPSLASSQSTSPIGSLTLLTASGTPYAFLAASTITGFRTALTATMIFNRRTNVHTICVFGAGLQALWHIRLALILRGPEIHHVHIINRNFERARKLMQEIYTSPQWEHLRKSNHKLDFSIVSNEYGEYNRLLKEHVRKADAIFCCTPSTTPLFPAEYLTSTEGRKKGRYISAIGSYKHHMIELHPDIIRQAVAPEHKHHHHHKHAERGGVIVVDSLEACMKEAGEVQQAGLAPEQMVEIGELLMVKKASMLEIEQGGEGEVGLKRWLQAGNVIFKCVGLGLMDICVGEDLVMLARERGFGTSVEGF